MKLEFGLKSQEYDAGGKPSRTKVTLVNGDGAIMPVFLPADKINLSNAELLESALDVIYQENFPQRAEAEKFSAVENKIEENKELARKAKQSSVENKELIETVSDITELLIALAVTQKDGMPTQTYTKIASFIKPLSKDKRYVNGDVVSAPYPYDTNDKWLKGTTTIFKFQMRVNEGYTYKSQTVEDMLQKGVLSIVMPDWE